QGPEDGVARTDKFVLVLPHPVERTTEQSVRPSGEVLMVTAWRPTNDDEAPAVSVYTYELPVPIADQEQLQLALAAEAHSIAASLGTINWEDACPVMGDAAACVSFNIFSVVGKVTTIGHGSTVVDIVTLGSSPENAARHELVVQTLAWLS
ncbi:MAG TPA: hypothetical protein PLV13_10395, partial [Ilumatobacteraceae bacterium]|nr:hypothetical protein [Ilumatobacteraceae bacterium]